MDEMKMYQEGQATCSGELAQTASMTEMLAQMRQIFADRDAEYARMEDAYQKRKESLDAKEASLKETVSGLLFFIQYLIQHFEPLVCSL